jgi:hypothetical protein
MTLETWQVVVGMVTVILGPAGGAAVGAKMAFNGIYKRLDRHEGKLDELTKGQAKHGERLSSIEAKLP